MPKPRVDEKIAEFEPCICRPGYGVNRDCTALHLGDQPVALYRNVGSGEDEWWVPPGMGQPLYKTLKLGKNESRAVAAVQRVRSVVEGITNWLRTLRRHGPRRTK